jgi:hypothetical protein
MKKAPPFDVQEVMIMQRMINGERMTMPKNEPKISIALFKTR